VTIYGLQKVKIFPNKVDSPDCEKYNILLKAIICKENDRAGYFKKMAKIIEIQVKSVLMLPVPLPTGPPL
jgi:hypothetical protein